VCVIDEKLKKDKSLRIDIIVRCDFTIFADGRWLTFDFKLLEDAAMFKPTKKQHEQESYELDNVYNEDDPRYVQATSSIWYN